MAFGHATLNIRIKKLKFKHSIGCNFDDDLVVYSLASATEANGVIQEVRVCGAGGQELLG